MFELSIQVRDAHTSMTVKDNPEEPITLSRSDPVLKQKVIEAVGKFIEATSSQEALDTIVRIKMTW